MGKKIEVTFVRGFSPRTQVTAEVVNNCLGQIRKKHGGKYTPDHVVTALANHKHPLHGELIWDDSEAAHNFRLTEAAKLMRSVYVVQIDNKPVNPRRIDFRVKEKSGTDVYTDEATILKTPDFRVQVAMRAWDELARWAERHEWLVEAGLLPDGLMDKVKKALEAHPRP